MGRNRPAVDVTPEIYWALEIAGLFRPGDPRAKLSEAASSALTEWAREKISQRVTLTTGARA